MEFHCGERKRMKKKNLLLNIWGVLYPLFIYFIITTAVSMVFSTLISFSMISSFIIDGAVNTAAYMAAVQERLNEYSLLILLIAMLISFPVLCYLFRRDWKRRAVSYQTPGPLFYIPVVFAGIGACIGLNYLISLLRIPELFPAYQEISKQIYGGNIVIQLVTVVAGAAVIEELLFRGIIYGRLKDFLGVRASLVISALLFGLYHMNMVQGIYAFIIGLVLAYVYEKFKTIAAPILAHGTANLVSILISETGILDFSEGSLLWSVVLAAVPLVILVCSLLVIRSRVSAVEKQEAVRIPAGNM